MKIILLLYFAILVASASNAQVALDQKAPEILVDQWVTNPHTGNTSLEGKAIVLDFWFTSCAPCVYTIPHLNDLITKYGDKDIAFVAISFENPEKIERFLKKKKFMAQVASDTSYRSVTNFQVTSYPTTFLIDKKGILKWSGNASRLNSDMLDLLLDEKYYQNVLSDESTTIGNKGDLREDLIYPISVEKNTYMDDASGMQFTDKEFSAVNKSLKNVIAGLTGSNEQRIRMTESGLYDVRFRIPAEVPEQMVSEAITRSLLAETGMKMSKVAEKESGYHFKLSDDSLLIVNGIVPGKVYYGMGSSANKTFWNGQGINSAILVAELERRFGVLIDDQVALSGPFEIRFPLSSFKEASQYLEDQYGFTFSPGEVEVTYTVVK